MARSNLGCVCPTCNGAHKAPWKEGQPWAFPHEVATNIAPPLPKPQETPKEASGDYIERVQARTDIGQGLKSMMIKNWMRKQSCT